MFKEIKRDTINLFIITIFIVVSCIYFMLCTIKYKFLIIFLCSMVIVLANSVLAPFLGSSDNKYFYFNSPDNKNTLVIEEWSWLLGGGAHCYLKENEFFLKRLDGYISTDDGYRAFSNNSYKIKWKDNKTCIIEYNNGQSGSDSVVINIDK